MPMFRNTLDTSYTINCSCKDKDSLVIMHSSCKSSLLLNSQWDQLLAVEKSSTHDMMWKSATVMEVLKILFPMEQRVTKILDIPHI